MAEMVRHYMPGVRIMNQIHFYLIKNREKLASHVDILLMPLDRLEEMQELVISRRQEGKLTGLYTMCYPLLPWPGYHLDKHLLCNRLFFWLMHHYNADAYDCWGVNWYYGVDPFKSSLGPLLYNPGGSPTAVGYPPGDNWLFYPTPDGLTPSMRMIAWRDGLQDFLLLKALKDREKAKQICASLFRSGINYELEPSSYHKARKALLDALDD
jgi:hypothetical protein